MLTGSNVVSCQDLKAHTNAAGEDMCDTALLHKERLKDKHYTG